MHGPLHGALRRRREAARHLRPLACGCRDPLFCDCWPPLPDVRPLLSEQMIGAGADAARHILETGQVPLLELDVLRELYWRGGGDRQLARELYELVGGGR